MSKLINVTVNVDGIKFGGTWNSEDVTSEDIAASVERTLDILVGDVYDVDLEFIEEVEV